MHVSRPPNTVPNPVFIAIHDLERRDRALVPVLNLAQDSIYTLGHGELAQDRIDNRYRVWRNLVGEIRPGCGLHGCVEFEGDFVAHIREPSVQSKGGATE